MKEGGQGATNPSPATFLCGWVSMWHAQLPSPSPRQVRRETFAKILTPHPECASQ